MLFKKNKPKATSVKRLCQANRIDDRSSFYLITIDGQDYIFQQINCSVRPYTVHFFYRWVDGKALQDGQDTKIPRAVYKAAEKAVRDYIKEILIAERNKDAERFNTYIKNLISNINGDKNG